MLEQKAEIHSSSTVTQHGAPWGLARISHVSKLDFGTFNKYPHEDFAGSGVNVYVLGTGIFTDHVDFEGRASWGINTVNETADDDNQGQGTHSAAIIAGHKHGVAKKANVIAVKIAKDSTGSSQTALLDGLAWVTERHKQTTAGSGKGTTQVSIKGSVALLTMGIAQQDGSADSLKSALDAAIEAGVHVVTLAGDDNTDSCTNLAMSSSSITVGASTLADDLAYFSNHGGCVDLIAPGLNIGSAWIGSSFAVKTLSSTEAAAAHVAGILAYFLSLSPEQYPGFDPTGISPSELKKYIISRANPDQLSGLPEGTPNVSAESLVIIASTG